MIIEDGMSKTLFRLRDAQFSPDPYYYLQYCDGDSTSPSRMPSFLSMDIDGRVLRTDSFSKIMMPGMRLGWITSSHLFHEHLISLTDSSTQHPHGFGQIFITEMLGSSGWGLDGFERWARSLCKEYQRRRDLFLQHFEDEVASTGFASADPPQAGMFVWIDVHVRMHPRYRSDIWEAEGLRTNVPELMDELFERCLDAGLVVMPASIFVPPATSEASKLLANDDSIQNVRGSAGISRVLVLMYALLSSASISCELPSLERSRRCSRLSKFLETFLRRSSTSQSNQLVLYIIS